MNSLEAEEKWKKFISNLAALNACVGPHDFQRNIPDRERFYGNYRCTKCGGELDAEYYDWYEMGLAHGKAAR